MKRFFTLLLLVSGLSGQAATQNITETNLKDLPQITVIFLTNQVVMLSNGVARLVSFASISNLISSGSGGGSAAQVWTNAQQIGNDPNGALGYIQLAGETNSTPRISFTQRDRGGSLSLRSYQGADSQALIRSNTDADGVAQDNLLQLQLNDHTGTDWYAEVENFSNDGTNVIFYYALYNDSKNFCLLDPTGFFEKIPYVFDTTYTIGGSSNLFTVRNHGTNQFVIRADVTTNATPLDVAGLLTAYGNLAVKTNVFPGAVATAGTFWASNYALYWVTPTKTNLITNGL